MNTRIKELFNQTIKKIEINEGRDQMTFELENGKTYQFYHEQECCEQVKIEDINGNLDDLIGCPLLLSEESTSNKNPENIDKNKEQLKYQDSFTWTFYRFATVKCYVTIRWYGMSNGCYSESVKFKEIKKRRSYRRYFN